MVTESEIAWIAGLLEGEGTFQYMKQTHCVYIAMRDDDVILKYGAIVEKITGIRPAVSIKESKNPHHSDLYIISLYGESARTIMRAVVKHMGKRRRAKIWQSLNKFYEKEGNMKLPEDFSKTITLSLKELKH